MLNVKGAQVLKLSEVQKLPGTIKKVTAMSMGEDHYTVLPTKDDSCILVSSNGIKICIPVSKVNDDLGYGILLKTPNQDIRKCAWMLETDEIMTWF